MRAGSSAWAQATPAVALGRAAHYGLLSATTITTQSAPIQVLGKAGAGENISSSVAATAGRFAQGSGTVPQALADLQQARNQCAALGGPAATPLSSALAGSSLSGGQITTAPTDFQGNGPFTGHYDSAYTPTSTTCGGPSAPGVYNFAGPVVTTSPDAIQHRQDSLKLGLGASQQQALLARVLRSYQPTATYDELESYLLSLAQTKPEVYKWATFALLQAYDYTDRPADAQRLRQTLTALATTDTELLSQLRLQEVRSHLRRQYSMLPSSALTEADLALLRLAATPNTPAGHQACQFLQAYEPACACTQNLITRYTPAVRPATPPLSDVVPILGEGHPNPATEQVSFSYQLPSDTPAAQLVVYNLLGQRVATQPVRTTVGELTLSVSAFPAGLYLAALEADGHRLATRKLLVIH